MVKKGASHVDWIISLGIFLVYILGVVIFIKPGLAPSYTPTELFDIVELSLMEDVELTVQRLPLYVQFPETLPAEPYYFEVDSKLPFDSEIPRSKLVMYDEDLEDTIGAEFRENNFQFSESVTPNTDKKYFVVYNPVGLLGPGIGEGSEVSISNYELGVIQNIDGILQSKVTGFKANNCSDALAYKLLKEAWKLPFDKEMEINYEFVNGLTGSGVICNNVDLVTPQQTNVFVVELVKPVLGNVGEYAGEVKINVKIW